jgi:hypothetical protein
MPIDDRNTHLHKLVCNDTIITACFVGYSINLADITEKRRQCSKTHERKVYKFIRDNGGFEKFHMVVIATKTCADKSEALRELRRYFEQSNGAFKKSFSIYFNEQNAYTCTEERIPREKPNNYKRPKVCAYTC